jgi:hypothetical protein
LRCRREEETFAALSGKLTFGEFCSAYVKDGLPFRKKDGRRKTKGTIETYQYHINNQILPRWKDVLAEEMKPLAIRNWLVDLHDGEDYVWGACSKIAGIMSLVFTFVPLLTTTRFTPSAILWIRSLFRRARRIKMR